MGYRIHSSEQTKLAYDGTPEAKVSEGPELYGEPSQHKDAPARGLPEGHPAGTRSVLSPGVNEVSDNEYALLNRDVNFRGHLRAGVLNFLDDDGRAIDPPPAPDYVPAPAVGVAGKPINEGGETLPEGRSDATAEATGDRRNPVTGKGGAPKKGDKVPGAPAVLTDEQRKDVEDFFSLNESDRVAMYPALTPEVKAAVDADPRAKPAA